MKGRKVLVTGANGFLARETIKQLYDKGAMVVATSLEDRPMYEMPLGTEYVRADFTNDDDVRELFKGRGIEDVIHHAALFSLSATKDMLHHVNVFGTERLLQGAVENDVRNFVVTSSGTVYKGGKRNLSECDCLEPCEVYGKSKLEQEKVVQEYMGAATKNGKLKCAIVRPAVIMGPESKYGGQVALFTHYLMGSLFQGMTAVPGDGNTELCFVHVEDCAALHIYMLEKDLADSNNSNYPAYAFNSVDRSHLTNNELADLVLSETKLPKYRSLLLGKKLPLPEAPSKWLGKYNDKLINWLKENKHPVPTVSLDSGSVELMFAGHVSMSTQKAIDAGFEHRHPYGEEWMREIVRHNIDTNWERLLGKKFSRLCRIL